MDPRYRATVSVNRGSCCVFPFRPHEWACAPLARVCVCVGVGVGVGVYCLHVYRSGAFGLRLGRVIRAGAGLRAMAVRGAPVISSAANH